MMRCALIGIVAAVLSGCSGMLTSNEPPLREYWLSPEAKLLNPEPRLQGLGLKIVITAPTGLDRHQLLHLEPTGQLREYAGARWTDYAPVIVANYIDLALEQATGIAVAERAALAGTRLDLELRTFFTRNRAGVDEALLEAVSRLRCGERTSARQLAFASAVRGDTLAMVIAAHRENLDSLSRDIEGQLLDTCAGEAA